MANNFGKVNVSVTASTGGLTAGLSRAGKTLRAFSSGVASIASPMSVLGSVAKSTFGQLALFSMARGAIGTITGMASAAAEGADQLSKLSRRLGTTYSELAGLKLAGDLAGVGIAEIGKAMTKADIAMVKAMNGSNESSRAFTTLGLAASSLSKMASADRFEAIAVAISRMPSEAEKSAAAVALFGKAGAELLPLFEDGASGIRQARQEAEKFGLALTNSQGRAIEDMNDSFTRVGVAIQGIIQQVTAILSPAITRISQTFTDFVGRVGGANIGQAIGKGIIEGAKYLAMVTDEIVNRFRELYFRIADSLGLATSKEAKRLSEMQAQLNAGIAPQVAVPGSGGFVTTLDPKFAAELAKLTKVVDQQRRELSPLSNIIADAEKSISAIMNTPDARRAAPPAIAQKSEIQRFLESIRLGAPPPKAPPAGMAMKVRLSSEDLRAIVAGSAEAESFINSLRRGADPRLEGREESRRTADATERTANAAEQLVRSGVVGLATI